MKNEECANCKFSSFQKDDSDEDCFLCLRFPPVIDTVFAISSNPQWKNAELSTVYWANPLVYPSHWCGEYIRREVSE